MRRSRLPQPNLFKTTLQELVPPQRMPAAVVLLKALLVEAMSKQTRAETDAGLSESRQNGRVEIGERADNDQNNA